MFAYNELSDLLNGELVTPIKKDGENIICLNSKGEEVIYSFEDFDFDKTVEERSFIVEEESETEENEIEENEETTIKPIKDYNFDSANDEHWLDKGDAELVAIKFGYKTTNRIKGIKEFVLEN